MEGFVIQIKVENLKYCNARRREKTNSIKGSRSLNPIEP